MLNNLKPLGGFIENTVRPLLDELHWLFEEMDKKGLRISEENVFIFLKEIADIHLKTLGAEILKTTIVTSIICFTLWKMQAFSSLF